MNRPQGQFSLVVALSVRCMCVVPSPCNLGQLRFEGSRCGNHHVLYCLEVRAGSGVVDLGGRQAFATLLASSKNLRFAFVSFLNLFLPQLEAKPDQASQFAPTSVTSFLASHPGLAAARSSHEG